MVRSRAGTAHPLEGVAPFADAAGAPSDALQCVCRNIGAVLCSVQFAELGLEVVDSAVETLQSDVQSVGRVSHAYFSPR